MAKLFSLILFILVSSFNLNFTYADSNSGLNVVQEDDKDNSTTEENEENKQEEEKWEEEEEEEEKKNNKEEKNTENTQSVLREKILNDFKEKLLKSTKGVQKSKTESIDSDFAVIIEQRNQDKLKKEQAQNKDKLNKDVLNLATKPIMDDKQSEEAKEIQKNYVNMIQKEIKEQENQQKQQLIEINNKIVEVNKQEMDIMQKIKNNENNIINSKQQLTGDVFEITDTGVTKEFLQTEKFQQFIKNYKVNLTKDTNEIPIVKLLVPQEKKIIDFETDDIPDELLSNVRSEDNRHIPYILTMNDFQNTATQAINNNDLDTVRGIVYLTKNPNYILNNGQTMLNYASSLSNMEITRFLIFNGANLDIRNLLGNTALHNAVLRNDIDMVKLLVKNNANLEIFNIDGYTPLMLSIIEGRSDITLYLLKFNQDLTLKNYRGETVLDIAAKHNRLVIKELVLEILAAEMQ